MIPFSLRPVCGRMDWLRSTSLSRLMPSGVSSKAQAKNSAKGRPTSPITASARITHSGAPARSSRKSAPCSTAQPSSR